jgi:hypothetical protein
MATEPGAQAVLAMVAAATTDAGTNRRAALAVGRIEGVVREALATTDPVEARLRLPRAVLVLHQELQPFLGMGVLASTVWLDAQQARLAARARELFGAVEGPQVVRGPEHEPLPTRGSGGSRLRL